MANPLYDALFAHHEGKSTPFLELADTSIITHGAFLGRAAQYANLLESLSATVGDRVAVQVEKSPDGLALYAACVMAGMVFLPLNPAYTAEEVAYFIEDSGARVVVCEGRKEAELATITTRMGATLTTMNADGTGSLQTQAAGLPTAFMPVDCAPDDLVGLLYTSGTTGRSKGAMLTHENLISNANVLAREWKFTANDILLHALPIFHTHGLFVAVNVSLIAGGRMIFLHKFDLDAVIERLPQATTMMGVPTFYTRLLGDPRFTKDLAPQMRLHISGSAPLLADTHVAFEDRTGHRILERYGMTETNMNTTNPYDGERRAGTVGKPLPGVEVKITDPKTGQTLPSGEIGGIEVRGPNVFKGYWNIPEKTAEELRNDGFFITGDLGQIDADGYLHIVGRNKDLIISGGYNIYPKEIELVLDEQDGVLESAVIGLPHSDFGETAIGVLVAKKGSTPDLDIIAQNIRKSLARFKLPQRLVLLPELPRNAMGKIQKNELRQLFKNLLNEPRD